MLIPETEPEGDSRDDEYGKHFRFLRENGLS